MKKAIAILLCLVFTMGTVSAFAEEYYTIEQIREQAAAGWRQSYTAHGRDVTVDIDLPTPDVDTMPVVKAEFAKMTPSFTEEETNWVIFCTAEENSLMYGTYTYPEAISGKIKKVPEAVYSNPSEFDKAYPSGTDLTLGEAIDIIRSTFVPADMDASEYQFDRPYELRVFGFYDAKTNKPILPGEYYLSFYQLLNGIPILCHSGRAYKERGDFYYDPRLAAVITGADAYAVYFDKIKSSETVTDDVPLCAVSKIISAIEAKIMDGHIRKVYELELGYVLYGDPEYAGSADILGHYYAAPAWRLNCLYVSNAKKEIPDYEGTDVFERDITEFASIIIDAQTGEMQDYMSGAKDRGIYKGFISWEDAAKK